MRLPEPRSNPQSQISPVLRTRQQARRAYDRLSSTYDWMAWRWERKTIGLGLKLLSASRGEHILEIGCGTGHTLAELARAVAPGGSLVGLDLSPGMLTVTRSTLANAPGVELTCADGLSLPFLAAHFDAIFMSSTLELFDTPEIPRVLAECRRVLKPAGRVGIVALAREGGLPGMLTVYECCHRWFPDVVDCRPIHLQHSLLDAGFQVIQSRRTHLYGLPVEVVVAANQ